MGEVRVRLRHFLDYVDATGVISKEYTCAADGQNSGPGYCEVRLLLTIRSYNTEFSDAGRVHCRNSVRAAIKITVDPHRR